MKKGLLNKRIVLDVFFLLVALILSFGMPAFAAQEVRYTKCNVHTQAKGNKVFIANYANFTRPGDGHHIIPAGTEITILKKSRKEFRFQVNGDDKVVHFQFHEPRMEMSVDDYIEKITSPNKVSLKNLSTLDLKGVAEGKALVGMTRDGVWTALGYPATHKTPSLEASTWIYWTNRYKTIGVDFDERGKVKVVRN